MKPGDHPDFFRLAPPPGASRESRIRLDRDGQFWHEGARVEKPSLARAMHAWLARHPDDGRVILENGYDWCYLEVDGPTAFVCDVRADARGAPQLVLADGSEQPLDAETLVVDEDGGLWATVSGDGPHRPAREARFLRQGQLALAPWLADDAPALIVLGRRFTIGARHRAERVADQ